MASKKYAYFNKGNKIGIVQQDTTSSTSNDYGMYKSPIDSATKALEVEYSYSPEYRAYNTPTVNINKFYVHAWGSVDGYLTFFKSSISTQYDWTVSPANAVTTGSSGDTGGQSLDYIVIGGGSKWSGVHRVQNAGADGLLKTHTRVEATLPYWQNKQVDFGADETIFDGGGNILHLADHFSAGDYLYISGSTAAFNNGLFLVDSVTKSTTHADSKVTLSNKYFNYISADSGSSGDIDSEITAPATFVAETDQSDISIYKVNKEHSYVLTDVEYMNNEDFDLDLSRYQASALVHYLKAKNAEEVGDIEKYEYYMSSFRKQVEKADESKKYGVRMAQGFWGMRK